MPRVTLKVLDERVRLRVEAIVEEHSFWPCAKGCDHCCRSLPHLPRVTAPEWTRLWEAISRLPDAQREAVTARLVPTGPGKVQCPLLDDTTGACLVYAARPIDCRSYGFYVERDAGLHCHLVTEAVEAHDARVLWGNGESLAAEVDALGERLTLDQWHAGHP